jgi:hypothetical protein
MPKIPEPNKASSTSLAITRFHEKRGDNYRRPHLGCSELGNPCDRALWYSFRWATTKHFDGRMHRLFLRGHREEELFIEELRAIGAEIHERDPDTKQQFRWTGHKGHLAGSADAVGYNLPEAPKTWAIVEFKTHSDKSFTDLKAHGVEKSKPDHFTQMQMYMGFAELTRALYLAVNKNTDELYSEWVHFQAHVFNDCRDRAKKIIDANEPLVGISADPNWYQCKFCDHKALCHADRVPDKNCRTCLHSTPIENGIWNCGLHNRSLRVEEQRIGCRSHLFIPALIRYADVVDGDVTWVKYQDKDSGICFANVTEEHTLAEDIPKFISDELVIASRSAVTHERMAEFKREFNVKVIQHPNYEEQAQ